MCRSYLAEECSGPSRRSKGMGAVFHDCRPSEASVRLFVASKSKRFLLSAYCTEEIPLHQSISGLSGGRDESEEERDAHACCVLQRG